METQLVTTMADKELAQLLQDEGLGAFADKFSRHTLAQLRVMDKLHLERFAKNTAKMPSSEREKFVAAIAENRREQVKRKGLTDVDEMMIGVDLVAFIGTFEGKTKAEVNAMEKKKTMDILRHAGMEKDDVDNFFAALGSQEVTQWLQKHGLEKWSAELQKAGFDALGMLQQLPIEDWEACIAKIKTMPELKQRQFISLVKQATQEIEGPPSKKPRLGKGSHADLKKNAEVGLQGWTRICHSDHRTQETIWKHLVWDMPVEQARLLAQKATRVRIQERGNPKKAVESLPDAYPIQDVRSGKPIGFGRRVAKGDVAQHWTVPPGGSLELLGNLWHNNFHWGRKGYDNLQTKIYHSCDNGGGIHWDSLRCGWKWGDVAELELYVDAEGERRKKWVDVAELELYVDAEGLDVTELGPCIDVEVV